MHDISRNGTIAFPTFARLLVIWFAPTVVYVLICPSSRSNPCVGWWMFPSTLVLLLWVPRDSFASLSVEVVSTKVFFAELWREKRLCGDFKTDRKLERMYLTLGPRLSRGEIRAYVRGAGFDAGPHDHVDDGSYSVQRGMEFCLGETYRQSWLRNCLRYLLPRTWLHTIDVQSRLWCNWRWVLVTEEAGTCWGQVHTRPQDQKCR